MENNNENKTQGRAYQGLEPFAPVSLPGFFTSPSIPDSSPLPEKKADEAQALSHPFRDRIPEHLFFLIISFLDPRNIYLYFHLIREDTRSLLNSIDFWEHLYHEDSISRQQVFQAAIERDYFAIFQLPKVRQDLSFKDIAGLEVKGKSLLAYTMQQSQLVLRRKYLAEARLKKTDIEEKVKGKLLELKSQGLEPPPDKPSPTADLREGKDVLRREQEFKELLKLFEKVTKRDLEHYISELEQDTRSYVRLYFDILFMNGEGWEAFIKEKGGFGQVLLTQLPFYSIHFGRGNHGFSVEHTAYHTNILSLMVALGNLEALFVNRKKIAALITLSLEIGVCELSTQCQRSVHFGKLLSQAARWDNEAEMELLLSLGVPVETELSHSSQYWTAMAEALMYQHNEAVKLLFGHGGLASLHARSFGNDALRTAAYGHIGNPIPNPRAILILHAAGVDINRPDSHVNSQTVLMKLARDAGMYINKIVKLRSVSFEEAFQIALSEPKYLEPYGLRTLPAKLETIRILLIFGADHSQVQDPRARETIAVMYQRNKGLRASFLDKRAWTKDHGTEQEEHKSSLRHAREFKESAETSPIKTEEKLLKTPTTDESNIVLENKSEQEDPFALRLHEVHRLLSQIKTTDNKKIPIIRASAESALEMIAPFLDRPSNFLNLSKDIEANLVLQMMAIQKFGLNDKTPEDKEAMILEWIRLGEIGNLRLLLKSNFLDANDVFMEESLIIHAIDYRQPEIVDLLLQQGARITHIPGLPQNKTILEYVLDRKLLDIAMVLLRNDVAFNPIRLGHTFPGGGTLLRLITATGDIELVSKLLDGGRVAEINLGTDFTPLYIAIQNFDIAMVDMLLRRGASIYAKPQERPEFALNFFLSCWYYTGFSGARLPRNFANASAMINLLTDRANLNEVSPDRVKLLFNNREFILVRALIVSGAKADEIAIEDLYAKLPRIIAEAKEENDWDTVVFWMNLLEKKSKEFLASLPAMDEVSTQSLSEDSDDEASLREDLFYKSKSILVITAMARDEKDWRYIEHIANTYSKKAQEYFSALYKNLQMAESKRSRRRTSADLTDEKGFEPADKKTNLTAPPPSEAKNDHTSNVTQELTRNFGPDSATSLPLSASTPDSNSRRNPEDKKILQGLRSNHFLVSAGPEATASTPPDTTSLRVPNSTHLDSSQ